MEPYLRESLLSKIADLREAISILDGFLVHAEENLAGRIYAEAIKDIKQARGDEWQRVKECFAAFKDESKGLR